MAGGVRALGRGLRMRCPTCGSGQLFVSFYRLRERCLSCGTAFEREEGYWVGAMIVLIGATEALFAAWFVGGMLLTWPDVPWTLLLVGGIVLNLAFPIVAYPWSKTAWMGLHDAFVPEEPVQQADAITALEAHRRAAAIAFRDDARDREEARARGEVSGTAAPDARAGAGVDVPTATGAEPSASERPGADASVGDDGSSAASCERPLPTRGRTCGRER